MMLELFSSLNIPCDPVPTPVPAVGTPGKAVPSWVHRCFVGMGLPGRTPDFGRFYGSRGAVLGDAALAKNLPHRSRENEFTDGRVYR
jgi:hypothetical protein